MSAHRDRADTYCGRLSHPVASPRRLRLGCLLVGNRGVMTLIHGSTSAVFVGADELGDIIITPIGELDIEFAPTVFAVMRESIAKAPRRIILDFGALTFLDSAGCDMLEEAWREAHAAGVRLAIREQMSRLVRRVLAVTLLLPLFDPVWPSPGW